MTRWKTIVFYGILLLLTILSVMIVISANTKVPCAAGEAKLSADLILDAGHGGLDGGAVSSDGVCEAPITLAVAEKTQLLFEFCGVSAAMTRTDCKSLDYHPEAGPRENKNADLSARLNIARNNPETPFLSIHLNQFPESKYSGAQIFYGQNGQLLAASLQDSFRNVLNPENQRVIKPAPEGVFLMKNISAPAVTIECGFLSNPRECALLQEEDYQQKIALAIVAGWENYNRR